ncbi:MAG: hypothetical protein GX660_17265 [Clostridiaceae bacterium]|nr:hypothetical protein [Clostridiaceae bacterium]
MKLIKRTLSSVIAVVFILSFITAEVNAAKAGVAVDESVYVNMDYYGKPTNISIVKGCSLNGNAVFTDYGSYDKVTNMSNEIAPNISGDMVSWELSGYNDRFYYECTPKNGTMALPWDFDISYKLNGAPVNADKLAGASGLVEININAKPNSNVQDYYKKNMLLTVEAIFDMSQTTSIEAPGAQMQSVGNYKAVVFLGLPGEENNYTIRIGTNCFETSGILMTMVPGTVEQLKDVKDLNKSKDTVKDSKDALYASLNETLNVIQSTSEGLKQVKSGLSKLEDARETISTSKDGLYADADKSIEHLTKISNELNKLIPHLQNGQSMIKTVNSNLNETVSAMNGFKADMDSFASSITKLQKDIENLNSILNIAEGYSDERKKLIKDIYKDIDDTDKILSDLEDDSKALGSDLAELASEINKLETAMKAMPVQMEATSQKLAQAAAAGMYDQTTAATVGVLNSELSAIISSLQPTIGDLAEVLSSTKSLVKDAGKMFSEGKYVLDTASNSVSLAEKYFSSVDAGLNAAQELLSETNNLGNTTKKFLDKSKTLIDNISNLNTTLNKYIEGMVNTLNDTEDLLKSFSSGLTDTQVFLYSLEATLKASGSALDVGTRKSLEGLVELLQKSLDGVAATSSTRNAIDTINNTVDEKIDEVEDDSNLLEIDADALPISFTSENNPAPQSIQIIVRTAEISTSDKKPAVDIEEHVEESGFISRMKKIFVIIWDKITSLFS